MTMLRQGHFEARRLISGVRPPILDESGVVAAVAHLVNEQRRQKGPTIEFLSKVEFDRLAPILENAIYRIVQEGLANACRHSKSQTVRMSNWCSTATGSASRSAIGESVSSPKKLGRDVSAWTASGNGPDCSAAKPPCKAPPAKAPALPWTCRWRSRSKGRRVRACTHAVVIVDTDRIA